jgi:phosphoglycerate dehydrogenase-like enzyme
MENTQNKPTVILKPAPQRTDRIFTLEALARLHAAYEVVDLETIPSEALFEEALPRAFAIIGQPDLPAERLAKASALKAIINVEGNFFPNVDYEAAFWKGIRVLGCGTAYAQAVAEYALGLALDLARGISREDGAARLGREKYVAESNADAVLLSGAPVGFIGFGNLGKAMMRLLAPFRNTVRIYDPWLPSAVIEEAGGAAASLDEVLKKSKFVFVFATATSENAHFLGADQFALLQPGARLVLVSRANVADYDALYAALAAGRFYAAIDVWPEEPIPADSPFRMLENVVLSGHRAGGIPEAFYSIGEMVLDDLALLAAGLPPARLQVAAPELVGRYRNKPVGEDTQQQTCWNNDCMSNEQLMALMGITEEDVEEMEFLRNL